MSVEVLITGGAGGIGFAAARELVRRGAHVYLSGRRREVLVETASRIGPGATPLVLDVTDPAGIAAAASEVEQTAGRLDVLVNNAAVLLDTQGTLFDLSAETLRATLETNLVGPLRVIQAFVPLLRRSGAPRIINVASSAGQLSGEPATWAPAYSVSKTALNMLTRMWSAALPGMAVNSMCPGWCRTDMGGEEAPRSPDEGADTLVWLALDAPAGATGRFWRDRQPQAW